MGVGEQLTPHTVGRIDSAEQRGSVKTEVRRTHFQGSSDAAEQIRQMIDVAAACDYPVLVIGETGVGKEVVAQSIHALSARGQHELIVADCATTTDSLLESELFGHKKGAFTGAEANHAGFVEKAHGSTLFLDEVDSMSPRMQASLLRVLETGEYRPVGENAHSRSDFRLIAAATPRLMHMVDARQFRQDLFYRISALRIHVPTLAERDGDAVELARMHAAALGFEIAPDALDEVRGYSWPGNIRQLRHCIEVASLSAYDGCIDAVGVARAIDAYRASSDRVPAPKTRDTARTMLIRASKALMEMPHFGAWEYARATGVSRRSAQRHLSRLLRLGHLTRLGAGRATRYKIRARPHPP
jgi:sigma-54-dependent transcriptional regulator